MNKFKNQILTILRIPFYSKTIRDIFRKFTKNEDFGSFLTRLPPSPSFFSKPYLQKCEVSGINFEVDLSDLVGWYTFWGFTDKPRRKLYSLVNPDNTVFDIGANLGEVSLNCSKIVGKKGMVYSFEPHPDNFAKLKKNRDLNKGLSLIINQIALGNEKTKLSMIELNDNNSGMNRFSDGPSIENKGILLDIMPLDDFVNGLELNSLDLIKIDVEGFEMKVLEGSIDTIKRYRPKMFIEIIDDNLRAQSSSATEIINLLEDLNYSITDALTDEKVTANSIKPETQMDIVCLPL